MGKLEAAISEQRQRAVESREAVANGTNLSLNERPLQGCASAVVAAPLGFVPFNGLDASFGDPAVNGRAYFHDAQNFGYGGSGCGNVPISHQASPPGVAPIMAVETGADGGISTGVSSLAHADPRPAE